MKFNLFKTKIPAFGMQINATNLKYLELTPAGSSVRIRSYAHVDLPKGMVSQDTISNADGLAEFIIKSMQAPTFGKLSTNHVIITLPESKSFVRVIHIPEMNEREIDNAVLFEAEAYIPLPIDQVYCDWQVLGVKDGRMELLIIAAPKAVVDAYVDVLEKANLHVIAVEVESQSLVRAILPKNSQETVLIVDLDANKTNMIMVQGGSLQFTSSIPVGGNTFTQKLAEALQITPAQASIIKKKVGIANTPEYPNVKTALLPIVKGLGEEIKNVLNFHYEHALNPVSRVLLSGGSSKMKNLPELLTDELHPTYSLPLQLANPWQNITKLEDSPLTDYDALSLTATIGAAMRILQ
jgi:type IV pilus assembly protein PilM